ncbi:MAG: hypothetical protein ACRD8A_12645 [Candidatus Acidiferrales bacterium]
MEIREYSSNDLDRVRELHALAGFDYELPELGSDSIAAARVVDDEGVQMAAILRWTTEAFLLVNGQWRTPGWRWLAMNELHEKVRTAAAAKGVEDSFCWLPPRIERAFGNRLSALGWAKERPWPSWSRRVA